MSQPTATAAPGGFATLETIRRIEHDWLARTDCGDLMARAAKELASAAARLLRDLPGRPEAVALVGPGNNGGDALLCLLELSICGYRTTAYFLGDPASTSGSPERVDALKRWRLANGPCRPLSDLPDDMQTSMTSIVVIDGLFGVGLNRPFDTCVVRAIQSINQRDRPTRVVAADIPSGLNADTGRVVADAFKPSDCKNTIKDTSNDTSNAIRADLTVTFIADKPGLHTGDGPDYAGQVIVANLNLPPEPLDGIRIDRDWVAGKLRPRQYSQHKGSFGFAGVIGGARSMPGAAILAAGGARAAGAGKIVMLSPDEAPFDPTQPQVMTQSMNEIDNVDDWLRRLSAAAIGCGLGQSDNARRLLLAALQSSLPLVIDADALNLIAATDDPDTTNAAPRSLAAALSERAARQPTVLTPHPLEAARLLGCTTAQIQADRVRAARRLADQTRCTVLLKGVGSVLAAPGDHWGLVMSGGPALASGGTGDILAGVITGLLAQSAHSGWEAAGVAAWIHGDAGDRWTLANAMASGLQSSELLAQIVRSINDCAN